MSGNQSKCIYFLFSTVTIIAGIAIIAGTVTSNTFRLKEGDISINTVFENHRKSLIQHCERSELHLHFEWTKVN